MSFDQPLDVSSIRSDILPILRSLRPLIEQLPDAISSLAQFTIVIDANVLLEDIRWHLLKRRAPDARSALQECISAEIVKLYATRRVIDEVQRHIPRIALEDGIDEQECRRLLLSLTTKLTVLELSEIEYEAYATGQDPDDAPTLALAQLIKAEGIMSRDTDIAAMGGQSISPEYMSVLRHHSRKAAISVTLQLSGSAVMMASGAALIGALKLLQTAIQVVMRLPPPVMLIGMVFAIAWLSNPKNRSVLAERFGLVVDRSGHVLGEVFQLTSHLLSEAEKHKPETLTLPSRDRAKSN
ncbi:PIN domain-containing protein [Ferrovibrio sp.]|uniref:PIN domain-containing protein n=1 Tax=Ferrovibrio sp. TaxID=1917215 RepID=UPI0025C263BB|nr:PIN domain-containing protein [Ferrovibrio sp.]